MAGDWVERKAEWGLSQPRPLTLLIGCGVVLAAMLLIVTGLVVSYLREQTLTASKAGIAQLNAVLSEAAGRSLRTIDTVLDDIQARLRIADAETPGSIPQHMTEPDIVVPLARRIEAAPAIGGVGLIDAAGNVVHSQGFWPQAELNVAARDYFVTLTTRPELDTAIGLPIKGSETQGLVIPIARRIKDTSGNFAGLAVVAVPVSDFIDFYRAVSLGPDGVIALVRSDGAVLARYPAPTGGDDGIPAALAVFTGDKPQTVETRRDDEGKWRISATRRLADYPAMVVVSRDGDQALVGWSRQASMFGAFAVCGVLAIGLMGLSIGRQIQVHNALAAMRAEKIENEHARLVAEAELLKKERLSVLGQFTATVANELRNPLSAIRNTLFTMREIATSSGLQLDRPIARIQRSIARCDRIIGDLMEYIRTPELTRVSVSFDEWLRDMLAEHGLPPTVTLSQELAATGAVVRVDADRIRHVVINLVDNAAQALGEMPPQGAPLRIAVSTAICDGTLEFAVADSGPGIPPENMARIFEPLFSTKSFGAGLGLSTVKQIVVQHGGTIDVDSAPGTGTKVTIRLPIEQVLRIAA